MHIGGRWRRPRARWPAFGTARTGRERPNTPVLVGVLVVIAIIAITVFRPKLQELWDAIADGINSL